MRITVAPVLNFKIKNHANNYEIGPTVLKYSTNLYCRISGRKFVKSRSGGVLFGVWDVKWLTRLRPLQLGAHLLRIADTAGNQVQTY